VLEARASDTAPEIALAVLGRCPCSPVSCDFPNVKLGGKETSNEQSPKIYGPRLPLPRETKFADLFDISQSDARLLVADPRVSWNVDQEVAPLV